MNNINFKTEPSLNEEAYRRDEPEEKAVTCSLCGDEYDKYETIEFRGRFTLRIPLIGNRTNIINTYVDKKYNLCAGCYNQLKDMLLS